ncbi:hypothetical protein CCZ28_11415 [Pseudomonas oryzihabitans]|nr:hypothetical protein CCZ28_11415 [Pseudomonas psychrotolerans]
MQAFEQECLEALRPAEERMNNALLEQTRHLSGFALRKTLAQWQRFELIDWIQENVELLSASPCIDPLALETLVQEITATLESALAGLDPAAPMTDEDIEAFDRELMGEAFDSDLDDEELDEFAFDDDFHQDDATAQAQRERQSALDKVLRGSSVNDLFRQLARRLHPDRELDPELKQQRGQQMQELTEARDQQDVFTLLELYERHIGESPLSALGDKEAVLELLKAQTARLRDEQQEILHRTPLRSHFYQHYYGSNPKLRQQKLKHSRDELQRDASKEEQITRSITSIATLRPYLEARYDGRREDELAALQAMLGEL